LIGILCHKKTYENKLIYEKLKSYGLKVKYVNSKFEDGFNLIISRVERDYLDEGIEKLKYYEKVCSVINNSKCVSICQNKYYTYRILKKYMPKTYYFSIYDYDKVVKNINCENDDIINKNNKNYNFNNKITNNTNFKNNKNNIGIYRKSITGKIIQSIVSKISFNKEKEYVIKPVYGGYGLNIYRFKNTDELRRIFINKFYDKFIVQEYIPYKHDLRIFVIGNEVVSTMERIPKNDWRGNVSLGASVKEFKITDEIEDMVLKCVEKIGCDIVGVDVLIDKDYKPYLLEMNITPQFRGIIKFKDIPEEIGKYVLKIYKR